MTIKKIKRKRITELRRGDNIFLSKGISEVKVTQRVEEGNEVFNEETCLEIPIKSSGISELIDDFNRKAPQPPVKKQLIEPDSEVGNQMNLSRKEWVLMPDFSDKKYIEDKQEHNSNLGIAIVLAGLDFPLLDEDGKELTDSDEKIKMLKAQGLSGTQFTQIVEDITGLTKWQEKSKKDFLA